MGVDIRCQFGVNVRARDLATVLAVLAGNEARKEPLQGGSYYTLGVSEKCEASTIEGCTDIKFDRDGEQRWAFFHYDFGEIAPGIMGRGIMPRSTPFWAAMCEGAIKFFGGRLCYNDCAQKDDSDWDLEVPAPTDVNTLASDGEEWEAWQDAMANVKPIIEGDMDRLLERCAYGKDGRWR